MKFKFLTRAEYNALDAKGQADYDKALKIYVDEFRTKYPDGLKVTFEIVRMQFTKDKVAVLVKEKEFAPAGRDGVSAFTYTEPQMQNLAATAGIPDSTALFGIVNSCIEPCKLSVTIRPVIKGEKYTKVDKTEGEYEVSTIRYENDAIVLSNDAQDGLSEVYQAVVKDSIMSAFKARRANARKAVVHNEPQDNGDVTP